MHSFSRVVLVEKGSLRWHAGGELPQRHAVRDNLRRRMRSARCLAEIETAPVGDTTADRQNFGKMLLVFGCIGTDFCKKIMRFAAFFEIY